MDYTKDEAAVVSVEPNGDFFEKNADNALSERDISAAVPAKYRGTEHDKREMSMLGKKQVLRRNFKFVTMLGFASTVMASWELLLP